MTTYEYDAAGNLTEIDSPGDVSDMTLSYDPDENWLLSSTSDSVTTIYTTDDFGRRTEEVSPAGTVTYAWDSVGHLVEVASDESTSTYEYGPAGMRERVTVTTSEGTSTTESVWSGMQLALERDADGTTYRYVYGPGGLPLELIVTPAGGQSVAYAYQCDRAGSVIGLTDAAGNLAAWYRYDPWGNVLSKGGTLADVNPLRYRGYYYDEATGLYYLPARYYDPETARFLSADPAAPSAGDPPTLNRLAYCAGDPINASDPTGAVTDIEWESWKHYYYDEPSTAGNRADARRETKKVRQPVSKARGAFQSQPPAMQVVAVESGGLQQAGDYAAMLALSLSAEDLQTMRDEGLSGRGAQLAIVTLISQPSVSWILAGAGAYMMYTGGVWFLGGVGLIGTVAGAPVGGVAVAGGIVLFVVGAGLVWAGGTAAEVQTGIDIPFCGR